MSMVGVAYVGVGDIVKIRGRERYYKVTKLAPKNASLMDEDGKMWRMDRRHLERVDDSLFTLRVPEAIGTTLGTVVRFHDATPEKDHDYVVIKLGLDTVNVARLGGDSNRYYAGVPLTKIYVVDVTA